MEQLSFDDLGSGLVPAPVPPPADAPEPEEWRESPSFPAYLVSSLGRVWSRRRMRVDGLYPVGGCLMKLQVWHNPEYPEQKYLHVRLTGPGRVQRTIKVHQLVAEAFIGRCPPGQVVRHGPNGSMDNRRSQLSYGSMKQNNGQDKERDGTLPIGELHGMAKLTMEIVSECRRRCAIGEVTHASLAAEFGVSSEGVRRAVVGLSWATCPVPPVISGPRTGERHQGAKLTREIVIEARRRHAAGELVNSMVKEYGVTWRTLNSAIKGISWTDVPMPDAS